VSLGIGPTRGREVFEGPRRAFIGAMWGVHRPGGPIGPPTQPRNTRTLSQPCAVAAS